MDLTLFIVIIILIFGIIYLINIISDLKKDIGNITGKTDENEYGMKTMIDKFKNGLEYLKDFL
jgi:hypothetical protein